MKKKIGILMIAVLVIGLFVYQTLDTSLIEALIGFSKFFLLFIWLSIVAMLINSDKS